jgi:hypothetical protein
METVPWSQLETNDLTELVELFSEIFPALAGDAVTAARVSRKFQLAEFSFAGPGKGA